MDLSIIVPIYNVEKYVRACIESLYRQGLDESRFEVILINDGTQDRSIEIIQDIIDQHNNITVIHQDNQGLSIARNKGIAIARGDYLLLPDSDDMLIDYSVKPMLEKALEEEPDMIIADFVQMNDNEIAFLNKKPIRQASEFTTIDIQGHELLEENYCRYYWRTMYKKRFLIDNNISFVPGIYAQDIPFTNECFLKVEKCLKTTWLLNIYRRGHSSASSSYSLRRANDTSIALGKVWNFINTNLPPLTKQKQEELVFHIFLSHIYAIPFGHLKGLPEIIKAYDFMKSELPILSFKHNLRQRIWTFLFYKVPTPIFSLFIYLKLSILKKSNQSPTLSHVSD